MDLYLPVDYVLCFTFWYSFNPISNTWEHAVLTPPVSAGPGGSRLGLVPHRLTDTEQIKKSPACRDSLFAGMQPG